MERNKTIMKLCYLQTTFYIVFLTALITRHRRGISQKTFAFLIILSLVGCAVSLTLGDYLRNMIRSSGFDVAGAVSYTHLDVYKRQGVWNTSNGYVSHSFNQFIQVDNGTLLGVDHGEGYPTALVLSKYVSDISSGNFQSGIATPCKLSLIHI